MEQIAFIRKLITEGKLEQALDYLGESEEISQSLKLDIDQLKFQYKSGQKEYLKGIITSTEWDKKRNKIVSAILINTRQVNVNKKDILNTNKNNHYGNRLFLDFTNCKSHRHGFPPESSTMEFKISFKTLNTIAKIKVFSDTSTADIANLLAKHTLSLPSFSHYKWFFYQGGKKVSSNIKMKLLSPSLLLTLKGIPDLPVIKAIGSDIIKA